MFLKTALSAVAFSAMATGAFAQGFTGGELTIDVFAFSEGDDLTATNYSGALEYAINRNISVALDLAAYDFSILDESISNVTLHGVYHLNDQTSVGAFVGSESIGDADTTLAGFEAGYETGQYEVEGYFAVYDNDSDTTVLGISGAYQITDNVAAIADLGFAGLDETDVVRISAGAAYEFNAGPTVYAELGNISADDFDSTYIGLGASIAFGAERGTTFDRRSIFDAVNPGF